MSHTPSHRHPKPSALALAALIAAGLSAPVGAELARVGPIDTANGFPQWYQDHNGLALDLCLPDNVDLQAGNCLTLPTDVPNPTLPESFPSNFAVEHFWFNAGASAAIAGQAKPAILVLAVEASFAGGVPKAGDQIAFGRIRVRFDVPVDGDYTVIHPYGELNFPNQRANDRVFYTDDVGIACTGDFSCAMKTGIGPFLRAVDQNGAPAQFVTINGKTMIANPAIPTRVTGGPNGNVFRIIGPGGAVVAQTEEFTVMGRVHTTQIPSPLRGERASYTRNASGTWVDVFASATAGIGRPTPNLSLSDTGDGTVIVPKLMTADPAPGRQGAFWGQANVNGGVVPSDVLVTNNADLPPLNQIKVPVHDVVTVTEASYNAVDKTLTVRATSSDETPPADLVLPAHGALALAGGVAIVPNLAVPPKDVTVQSMTGGGSATAPVTIGQAAAGGPPPLDPVSVEGNEDTRLVVRVGPDNAGGTYRMITQPVHGTLTVDPANPSIYNYDPNTNFEGNDSFTYVFNKNGIDSNIVPVSLKVLPVNDAPVANPDSATTTLGRSVTINLLANDVDPDLTTGIDPASVQILTTLTAAQGSVVVNNGVATFTPGTDLGNIIFSYTVSDKASPAIVSSPATVTVAVQGAETITVANPEYRANQQRFRANGTSSVRAGQTVTMYLFDGTNKYEAVPVGIAVVAPDGSWGIDARPSPIAPFGAYNRVIVTSPLGGSGVSGTLRIR